MQNKDEKQKDQTEKDGSGLIHQNVMAKVIDKIRGAENILVALSRDPSVDEVAAAIGLALFLDEQKKHTTAIYSGKMPDTLQFLQPEETFEKNTDSLQDFIIVLNSEKADHLRYSLEGDFVKVYITPYKSKITEQDLQFEYGDYAVDLVLAIGVPSAGDLDEALKEYGRIMHDATTINITADEPGRFGELEWSDQKASSVSEMITKLIFRMNGNDVVLDKDIATALLTGIMAATNRFSSGRTDPETLELASKLMAMGADQQLIAAHVMDTMPSSVVPPVEEPAPSALTAAAEAKPTEPYTPFVEIKAPDGTVTSTMPSLPPVQAPVAQEEADPGKFTIPNTEPPIQPDTPLPEILVEKPPVPSIEDRQMMAQASSQALDGAVNAVLDNAAAAGASGLGMGPMQNRAIEQYGQSVTVPAPAPEQKDYAGMMAEALGQAPAPGVGVPGGAGALGAPVETPAGVPVGTMPVPAPGGVALTTTGAPAQMMPAVEPVAPETIEPVMPGMAGPAQPVEAGAEIVMPGGAEPAPNQNVVLPPPPAPVIGAEAMPPVLPNVQADPGTFQVPGMVQ